MTDPELLKDVVLKVTVSGAEAKMVDWGRKQLVLTRAGFLRHGIELALRDAEARADRRAARIQKMKEEADEPDR